MSVGLSNGYINSLKKSPTADKLQMIIGAYPDLSINWLLTGEGEMLNAPGGKKQGDGGVELRPRIPLSASAGFLSGIAQGVRLEDCELLPVIPGVAEYACTITVRGDSMMPYYHSGDEIALQPVLDRRAIQWGNVYVLDTNDGILLKRIYDHGETLRCVSYNKEYVDSYVDKSSINSLWRVVAMLRRF